jgi:hypothetical protein
MSIGSLNPLSSILQSVFTSAIQATGLKTDPANRSLNGTGALSSVAQATDKTRLSPLAQLMSELQKLQQSDPARYQEVTQQISAKLQSAAQTAQASGDTTAATQLTQLAADFNNASKSGQLPGVRDLAQAMGGHQQHHPVEAAYGDSTGTSAIALTKSASQTPNPLLEAHQTNGTRGAAADPIGIIRSTLSSVGISGTQD